MHSDQAFSGEGTYLLHKACHIIGAGGLHAGEGLCTWSISSFDQGGLFGAKAILYLLGIGFPEFKSKTLLVDIWPEQSAEQRRMERRGFNPPPEAQCSWMYRHDSTTMLRCTRCFEY